MASAAKTGWRRTVTHGTGSSVHLYVGMVDGAFTLPVGHNPSFGQALYLSGGVLNRLSLLSDTLRHHAADATDPASLLGRHAVHGEPRGLQSLLERAHGGLQSYDEDAGDAYRRNREWLPFVHRRLDFLTRAAQDLGYDVCGLGGHPSAAARGGSA